MNDRKRNICFFINDATIGGGQIHLVQLLKRMNTSQYCLYVVCSNEGGLLPEFQRYSRELFTVSMSRKIRIASLLKLVHIIRKKRIDIVHTHGGIAGMWGRLAAIIARPGGVVHTYHGIHFLHYPNPLLRKLFIWLDRLLNNFTDHIICVSGADRENGLKHTLFPAEKCRVIHNGIDPWERNSKGRSISKKDMGVDKEDFVICHIGRFDPIKGQKDLIHAFRKVVQTIPSAKLVMVGDGELKNELKSLVEDFKLRDNVLFLGFRQDVKNLLSLSHCFVLSSFSEGLPLSVLEAMSLGVPVVATRVGGLEEIIEDGRDGHLVPAGDPQRFADAVISIHHHPKQAGKMGKLAQKKVSHFFHVDKMIETVTNVYVSIGETV